MNIISKIEISDDNDITFFFNGSNEPFSSREFFGNTQKNLEIIEDIILLINEREIDMLTVL